MKRTIAVGLALAMALMGVIPAGAAPAEGSDASLGAGDMSAMKHDPGERDWGDQGWGDQGWGDRNGGWGDHGQRSRLDLEGSWIAKVVNAGPQFGFSRGIGGFKTGLLPRYLRIDQRRNVIRVADFKDRVLQEIFVAGFRSPTDRGGQIIGRWRDSKLETVQMGPRQTRITQTFALANRGRTLVIHTRQDGRGARRDVEFTTVYQRA